MSTPIRHCAILYDDRRIPHPDAIIPPRYRKVNGKRLRYYVVWIGAEVGVFFFWEGGAKEHIDGVPNAAYQGFNTFDAAVNHYRDMYDKGLIERVNVPPLPPVTTPARPSCSRVAPVTSPPAYVSSRDPTPAPGQAIWPIEIPDSPGDNPSHPIAVNSSPVVPAPVATHRQEAGRIAPVTSESTGAAHGPQLRPSVDSHQVLTRTPASQLAAEAAALQAASSDSSANDSTAHTSATKATAGTSQAVASAARGTTSAQERGIAGSSKVTGLTKTSKTSVSTSSPPSSLASSAISSLPTSSESSARFSPARPLAPPTSPTPVRHAPVSSPAPTQPSTPIPLSPPLARVLFGTRDTSNVTHRTRTPTSVRTSAPNATASPPRTPARQTGSAYSAIIDNATRSAVRHGATVNINIHFHMSPDPNIPMPSPHRPRQESVPLSPDAANEFFEVSQGWLSPASVPAVDEDLTGSDDWRIDGYYDEVDPVPPRPYNP